MIKGSSESCCCRLHSWLFNSTLFGCLHCFSIRLSTFYAFDRSADPLIVSAIIELYCVWSLGSSRLKLTTSSRFHFLCLVEWFNPEPYLPFCWLFWVLVRNSCHLLREGQFLWLLLVYLGVLVWKLVGECIYSVWFGVGLEVLLELFLVWIWFFRLITLLVSLLVLILAGVGWFSWWFCSCWASLVEVSVSLVCLLSWRQSCWLILLLCSLLGGKPDSTEQRLTQIAWTVQDSVISRDFHLYAACLGLLLAK